MRIKARIYFDAEPIENKWTRVGSSRATRIEVDRLASKILQTLDFRARENVQFGWEKMHQIINALVDFTDFRVILEVGEDIAVDDRRVDTLEIQEVMHVLEWPARYDRKNPH